MRKKIKKALPLVLWSLLFLWATHASECNITCNHNGSTVTINNSCDITKTVDCRWNNLKLNRNVIVNIKPGGNLSMDLKNNRIDLAPGAKINIDKNAKIANIFVKPHVFTVKWKDKHIMTMSNMTTPWPYWYESKEDLQSWTVPRWVHSIKIDFDAERLEEFGYDHVEFRIYKNRHRVYNLRKWDRWSHHVRYNMSVNPWDTIKIWYYEYHDRSVTLWHSHLKNIKITYNVDRYDVVIKWYLKWVNKVYVELSPNWNDNYIYSYLMNNIEVTNDIVYNILSKLGNPSTNSNTTVRVKLVWNNWQVVYSDPFKLSNSYNNTKEYTMSNMTTPWPYWYESKEDLQSWTVPSRVHSIKIDFDTDRHEEICSDHVEFRIYKNGSRVYNLWKRYRWSYHVKYNMSVNPWDTIKIWYYEYHNREITRWHSHLKNIKITYEGNL